MEGLASSEPAQREKLSSSAIVFRYVCIAVISSLFNIAAQRMSLLIMPASQIVASIAVGTAVGFLVKFICDKYWVFLDPYTDHAGEARKFVVYGIFGVATTAIFWIVEISFWYIFKTPEAKYAGAVLGLVIGNLVKYRLDKRYVFAGDLS